jgi:hypothetical protein
MLRNTKITGGKCSETKAADGATAGTELLGENRLFSASFTDRNSNNHPKKQECLIRLLVETPLTSRPLNHEYHSFIFQAHPTEIHHHMVNNTEIENH